MKTFKIGGPRYLQAIIIGICLVSFGVWILLFGAWGNFLKFGIGPLIIIHTLIFALPQAYYSKGYWIVEEDKIKISSHDDFFEQAISFYLNQSKNKQEYQVIIDINQIKKIMITYRKIHMLYYGYYRRPHLFSFNNEKWGYYSI